MKVAALYLLFATLGLSAISFDASSAYGPSYSNTSPLTFSHTVASGANRILMVYVLEGNTGAADVTGITFNGVSASLVSTYSYSGAVNTSAYVYCLAGAAATTANVEVSFTGYSGWQYWVVADSFLGTSCPTNYNWAQSSSGVTNFANPRTVGANSWIVGPGWDDYYTGLSAYTATTESNNDGGYRGTFYGGPFSAGANSLQMQNLYVATKFIGGVFELPLSSATGSIHHKVSSD